MLFYDEDDNIYIKIDDYEFEILYDTSIINIDGKLYTYIHGYFYETTDNGYEKYEVNWNKKVYPRDIGDFGIKDIINFWDKFNKIQVLFK